MKSILAALLAVLCFSMFLSTYGLLWQPIGPAPNPQPVDQSKIDLINFEIARMKVRWYYLDYVCDPNAVFALMYLYMTVGGRDSLLNGYYENGNQMADLIHKFSLRYANAIESWALGNRQVNQYLTQPWIDDFEYAASNYSSVSENVLMSVNVHINFDLGQAVYQANSPVSLKQDYDRVNDMMEALGNTINTDIGRRYDPTYGPNAIPLLDSAALDALISWREGAWQNGQQMRSALLQTQRDVIVSTMQVNTNTISLTQKTYNSGNGQTAAARIAYCQANHAPLPF